MEATKWTCHMKKRTCLNMLEVERTSWVVLHTYHGLVEGLFHQGHTSLVHRATVRQEARL